MLHYNDKNQTYPLRRQTFGHTFLDATSIVSDNRSSSVSNMPVNIAHSVLDVTVTTIVALL